MALVLPLRGICPRQFPATLLRISCLPALPCLPFLSLLGAMEGHATPFCKGYPGLEMMKEVRGGAEHSEEGLGGGTGRRGHYSWREPLSGYLCAQLLEWCPPH